MGPQPIPLEILRDMMYKIDERVVWVRVNFQTFSVVMPAILDNTITDGGEELVAVWCATTDKKAWLREQDYGVAWEAFLERPPEK